MSRFDSVMTRVQASAPARWLAERERNEQRVILALAGLVVFVVLWLGVWKPVADWRAQQDSRYRNAQVNLDWMRSNEARARELARVSSAQGGDRSLIPLITRSAEVQGITLTRLQPEAGGAVSIVLQGQPFNEVVRWLHQLEQNNGVTVARVSFDADARSGLVNAQVRLQ